MFGLPLSPHARQDALGEVLGTELAKDIARELDRDKATRMRVSTAEPAVGAGAVVVASAGTGVGAGAGAAAATAGAGAPAVAKMPERITGAQRNRRERHNAEVEAAQARKQQRQFLAELDRCVRLTEVGPVEVTSWAPCSPLCPLVAPCGSLWLLLVVCGTVEGFMQQTLAPLPVDFPFHPSLLCAAAAAAVAVDWWWWCFQGQVNREGD